MNFNPQLNIETTNAICRYLDTKTLGSFATTCKEFNHYLTDQAIWKELAIRIINNIPNNCSDWKLFVKDNGIIRISLKPRFIGAKPPTSKVEFHLQNNEIRIITRQVQEKRS